MEIFRMTINISDPYKIIKNNCKVEKNRVTLFEYNHMLKGNIYLISLGKAACSMSKAICEILDDKLIKGICITKYGCTESIPKIDILESSHPSPDENSIKAAKKVIKIAQEAKSNDTVIVLISGGGSSLVEKPIKPITLKEVKILTESLLNSGANIHEINIVRRHISDFKGGKLLKAIHPAKTISIMLSDVVGDKIEDIASGPTVKDPTTFQDAKRILKFYKLWNKIPHSIRDVINRGIKGEIEETLKDYKGYTVKNIVIGSNMIFQQLSKYIYEKYKIPVHILSTEIEGEASSWGLILGSLVREIKINKRPFKPPCVLLAGGEVTVTLTQNHGLGGPNQEVALASSIKIAGLKDIIISSIDTDGTDGPTDAAGGIVDGDTFNKIKNLGINPKEGLLNHNSYHVLKKVNSLIFTGATKTNINDIYVAAIL